jgi:hypothetical protein
MHLHLVEHAEHVTLFEHEKAARRDGASQPLQLTITELIGIQFGTGIGILFRISVLW